LQGFFVFVLKSTLTFFGYKGVDSNSSNIYF